MVSEVKALSSQLKDANAMLKDVQCDISVNDATLLEVKSLHEENDNLKAQLEDLDALYKVSQSEFERVVANLEEKQCALEGKEVEVSELKTLLDEEKYKKQVGDFSLVDFVTSLKN